MAPSSNISPSTATLRPRTGYSFSVSSAARCGVDLLLTVGGAMRTGRDSAAALGANAVHCRDKDEALARLTAYCRPGDAVLVKASHGMAFETILDGFYKAVPRD